MRAPSLFASDPCEPLSLLCLPHAAPLPLRGVRQLRFEFSSRGDRVPGRLLLPERASAPSPLVLVVHGARSSKDAPEMDDACGPWAHAGAAVAALDLPLHGERASAKLTERLLAIAEGRRRWDGFDAELWIEFVRQAVIDLRRALRALAALEEVDAERSAVAGFHIGTVIGAPFCAEEPRVRAAAFAASGAGFGPVGVDPLGHIARIAPRPVLFVNASRDGRVSRQAVEALHEAAREPKEVLWFDGAHGRVSEAALAAMAAFFARHLGLPA